jgi:uncharacterized membrane protein
MIVGIAFHILGAVVWVGGMFFALMVLRPSVGPLEPAVRLALWHRVFSRFFAWVWVSVAVLLVSGFAMVLLGFGGFGAVGKYVHAMMAVGILMMLIYAHLYFAPWQRFRRAVEAADWPTAAKNIDQIRLLVTVNLVLGLITAVIGASGRYYG